MTALDPSRIEALCGRYALDQRAQKRLQELAGLVANDPLAPTSIRDPIRVLEDHVADSLVALNVGELTRASTLADLGSGAGMPGIPLAIALPDARVALVESSARKCDFLRRAIDVCGLSNANVIHARAEEWDRGFGGSDVVTARALDALPVVVEYAAPLLRVGGTVVVWRGRPDNADEMAGAAAAEQLGLQVGERLRVRPYERAEHRYLHLMSKVRETPPGYPRRAGMARKRPLGVAPGRQSSDRAQR
jgi:16S rRNA (guanine527-N7)-methyltransferase